MRLFVGPPIPRHEGSRFLERGAQLQVGFTVQVEGLLSNLQVSNLQVEGLLRLLLLEVLLNLLRIQ